MDKRTVRGPDAGASVLFTPLLIALVVMFVQQSFMTAAKSTVPLIAPAALPDLGVPAAAVGLFVALTAFVQIFVVLGCGGLLERYGGLRTSQIGLALIAAGLAVAASGTVWPFLIAAILISCGTSVATPASSQVLARYATPKSAPLIFSAKQSSAPIGLMAAGILIPAFVAAFGWRGALLAVALLCLGYALLIQPLRAELDKDRDPAKRFGFGDIRKTFVQTVTTPALRRLGLTAGAFAGVQATYVSFYVLFLTESLGYSLSTAGAFFAAATAASIPMRVLWGYMANRWFSVHKAMVMISLLMALSCVLVGLSGPHWAAWQVLGAAFLMTSTALSWAGIILAETACLVPARKAGRATGGVLAVNALGYMLMPLGFGAILALTGSYALGFFFVAIPPLLIGLMLVNMGATAARQDKTGPPGPHDPVVQGRKPPSP